MADRSGPVEISRDRPRLGWIDELRFLSFCAVALLHVSWIETTAPGRYDLVSFATRFAVPVFFLITGYLVVPGRRDAGATIRQTFGRLMPVFVVWEAIYVVVDVWTAGALYPLPATDAKSLARFVAATIYGGGVAFHLWFLVWLWVSVVIVVTTRRAGAGVAWTVAAVLFAIGLAIGPYGGATGAIDHVGPLTTRPIAYSARNGPFFGPLLLLIGGWLADRRSAVPVMASAAAIVGGLGLEIGEGVWIAARSGRFVSVWDVTLGTPIFAVGVFCLWRSLRADAATSAMARWGRVSLGAYCVHALFTGAWNAVFLPADRATVPLTATVAAALAVIVVSTVTAGVAARVPWLRRFVT